MLTFGLYALAYLAFGYVCGKIDNAVYFDDTPSEKAGFLKRTARILFFPVACHKWEYRQKHFEGIMDEWISLRGGVGAHIIPPDGEQKERYCKLTTFLWPLKLIPIAAGAVSVSIKAMCFIGSMPLKSFNFCWNFAGRLKSIVEIKLPRLTGAIAEEFGAIELADSAKNGASRVQELIDTLKLRELELENHKNDWLKLGTKSPPVIDAIASEIADIKSKRELLRLLANDLSERESGLRSSAQEMALLKKTASLSVAVAVPADSGDTFVKSDGLAVLMSRSIGKAKAQMAEAREILKKVEEFNL